MYCNTIPILYSPGVAIPVSAYNESLITAAMLSSTQAVILPLESIRPCSALPVPLNITEYPAAADVSSCPYNTN